MNRFTGAMCNKCRAAQWAEVLRLRKSMIHYLIIQLNGGQKEIQENLSILVCRKPGFVL